MLEVSRPNSTKAFHDRTSLNSITNDIYFVGVSFVLRKLLVVGGGGAPPPSLILQKCVIALSKWGFLRHMRTRLKQGASITSSN